MTIPQHAFSTLSLAIACVLLAACGCDQGPSDKGATSQPAATRTVNVAAAADLRYALDEVIAEFARAQPAIRVTPVYGSSGNFYSQLSSKAPFDVYLSADIDYPRKLIEAGLASRETLFEYAVGQIVVWTPKDSPVDVAALGIESLTHPSVKKIAIANPQHAPYGRAAEAAMKKLGVYDRVKDQLVLGENVAQAAQFVESGAADAGVIALSLAVAPAMKDKGRHWVVPADAYPPLRQGGVILSWAQDADAAGQFRAFVTGAGGATILRRHGFAPPAQ
jgi:molybdate transport system substrate-binding protein